MATLVTKNDTTFSVNDILVIRGVATSGIQEEWMRVTAVNGGGSYTVTRDLAGLYSANANPAWKAGIPIVKQGSSNGSDTYSGGWLRLIGEGTNSPYYSVFKRTGLAYNAYTETCRLGNLNGFLGYATDEYGIAIGDTTGYLKYDPTNGIRLLGDIIATTYFEAGEALTANDWVFIADDGKVYKTDASTSNRTLRTIGVCLVTTALAGQAPIQMSDKTTAVSGLTIAYPYYIQSPTIFTEHTTGGHIDAISGTYWMAQTFTPGSDIVCSGAYAYIKTNGTPTADITCSIRATSSSKPTGGDLAVGTIVSTIVTSTNAKIYISFNTPVTLSSGTMYSLVLRSPSATAINGYSGDYDDSSAYADGNYCVSSDSGANWSTPANNDMHFGIHTSPGTIGTSAGVISKKIGLALSSTKLLIQNT